MIELKLTEQEVVLLSALVGATSGSDLNAVYEELIHILHLLDPQLVKISGLMTDDIAGILNGKQIIEEDIYDGVIEFLTKVKG